jgi:large subunit ribosomal protein L10
MNLEQKQAFVEEIRGRLEAAPLVILTDFKGSTVEELNGFRRACEAGDMQVRVVKNTLCRRAVAGTEMESLSAHFRGNVAVVLSGDDPIAAAKLFKAQAKENKKLEPRAGFFEGDLLDPIGVVAVADLPSREELLVALLRTLTEGPRQVLGVIQGPARDLAYVLQNYAKKLEDEG